jgi:hypothetical protein
MILRADARHIPLADGCVHMICTSPPYWGLRRYEGVGDAGIGLEPTLELYVANIVKVFREVRRVLHPTGTCWLNLGDSYAGGAGRWGGYDDIYGKQATNAGSHSQGKSQPWKHPTLKPKDLIGMPWRVAFALQADGWWLRSDIIWAKPNPMPESVQGSQWLRHEISVDGEWVDCPGCPKCEENDGYVLCMSAGRPTRAHEYVFLLTKNSSYYYDAEAIRESTGSEVSVEEYERLRRDTPEAWYQRQSNPFSNGRKAGNKTGGISPPGGRNKRDVWTIPSEPMGDWTYDFDGADYVDNHGIPRKLSPDCPVHQPLREPRQVFLGRGECDESKGRPSIHNRRTDDDLVLAQARVDAPILQNTDADNQFCEILSSKELSKIIVSQPQTSEPQMVVDNSDIPVELGSSLDLQSREDSQIASVSNNQSRKKDHAQRSFLHGSVSEETSDGIGRTQHPPSSTAQDEDSAANKTLALPFSLNGQQPDKREQASGNDRRRNRTKAYTHATCICAVSQTSHFACFPQALVMPCILAGTSAKGCCSECGAPWVRVTDVSYRVQSAIAATDKARNGLQGNNFATRALGRATKQVQTLDWQPSCKHDAPIKPCLVLDPFCGSATTLVVAERLGRRAIGLELSEDYIGIAQRRTAQRGLFA